MLSERTLYAGRRAYHRRPKNRGENRATRSWQNGSWQLQIRAVARSEEITVLVFIIEIIISPMESDPPGEDGQREDNVIPWEVRIA